MDDKKFIVKKISFDDYDKLKDFEPGIKYKIKNVGDIKDYVFSDNIHALYFSDNFDFDLLPKYFPRNLHTISMTYFELKSKIKLPKNLHTLILNDANVSVRGLIPKNLHTLIFRGQCYPDDLSVGDLPDNLHTLYFSCGGNPEIHEHALPKKLHTLKFYFFQMQDSLVNVFPLNLYSLEFESVDGDDDFDANLLPRSLRVFKLGESFGGKIIGVLPDLHTLYLGDNYSHKLRQGVLPESLYLLHADTYAYKHVLPENLHTLYIGDPCDVKITRDILPHNLHTLHLGDCFHEKVTSRMLPRKLQLLILPKKYEHELPKTNAKIVFDDNKK